jgi:hypothetical protein
VTKRVVGGLDDVTRALATDGLLLLQDAKARSLATMVAGDVVKGSWWGHPKGNEMFAIASALEEIAANGKRIKTAKLVDGKVTFVHERLWPALHAVGRSREAWQVAKLSKEALALLATVDDNGIRAKGAAAKLLEVRLLVDAHQVHTDTGRHETELRAWPTSDLSVSEAKRALEVAAKAIGAEGRLPWL